MILQNFILLRTFTVAPEVMWTLAMMLPHTEVKSQTSLSSLQVSCKRALT